MVKLFDIGLMVVGAVIGVVISTLIPDGGQFLDWVQAGSLMAAVVLLGLLCLGISRVYKEVIYPHPTLRVIQSTSDDRANLYKELGLAVARAQERLVTVSYHVAGPDPVVTATGVYYDAIDDLIRRKKEENAHFEYTRIYQFNDRDTPISNSTIGDRGYLHFEKLVPLVEDNVMSPLKVNFLKMNLAVQASFVFVDKTELFIGLSGATKYGMITTTWLHITDGSGHQLAHFERIIAELKGIAVPARAVEV